MSNKTKKQLLLNLPYFIAGMYQSGRSVENCRGRRQV